MSSEPMSLDPAPTPDSDVHFHEFNKLPIELRDMVWDNALIAEATNRMVFAHVFADPRTGTIYPTKHLVSKIMQVCYASNKRAKQIYNCREVVYEVVWRDTLPCPAGYEFDEFELGEEVGAVYLSPQHDTFCVGFTWPLLGLCPTHDCMRGVSYYSTRAFDMHSPLLLSVLKVCSFDKYGVNSQDSREDFRGEGTPGYSTLWPSGDIEIDIKMFPNVQRWFAILYPHIIDTQLPIEIEDLILTTDVQVIANEGWEGQCRLMNESPKKYAVAELRGKNPPSVIFFPLSLLGQFINTYFL
ncbi:hypothetical protein F4679DRAFT_16352 [Xylaria curta]|nr:hypothetical protein F4679DRAFT_16352 [Xylaria curta]